eukprot:TRINITY_DN6784_c0_g1_i3.p1 TRINITY_DN6784_c0_g1~~TRINITY_DN6784_c0_g1_i3.p1  ORF type:complete len:320 (-),score=37.52 TRINITY_DN6784_c0_g1_i3:119-1078(-)
MSALAYICLLVCFISVLEASPCPSAPDYKRLSTYADGVVAHAGLCDQMSWSVGDLGENRAESPLATRGFESASSIKLWVLISVLDDISHGLYNFQTQLDCSDGFYTIDHCIQLMINISDNCATYALVTQTTLVKLNTMMHTTLNMSGCTLHHWCPSYCKYYKTPCPNTDGHADLDNTLTTHDVLTGLSLLHQFKVLSQLYTYKAYSYLEDAAGWYPMIARFVPADVKVAHKQGWLPATDGFNPLTENDTGIVFACADYGVAVLTEVTWNATTQATEDQVALDAGAEISRLAYCTFQSDGICRDGVKCSDVWSQPPLPGC